MTPPRKKGDDGNGNDADHEKPPADGKINIPRIRVEGALRRGAYVQRPSDYTARLNEADEAGMFTGRGTVSERIRRISEKQTELYQNLTKFQQSNLSLLDLKALRDAFDKYSQDYPNDPLMPYLQGLASALDESLKQKKEAKYANKAPYLISEFDLERVTVDWDNTGDMAVVDAITAIGALYNPDMANLNEDSPKFIAACTKAVKACEDALEKTEETHPAVRWLGVIPGIVALAAGITLGFITACTVGWMAWGAVNITGKAGNLCDDSIGMDDIDRADAKVEEKAFKATAAVFWPSRILIEAGMLLVFNTSKENKEHAREALTNTLSTPARERHQHAPTQAATEPVTSARDIHPFERGLKDSEVVKDASEELATRPKKR